MRLLMIFQAPTQMYDFMFYIVPYVFDDYGPWTIYYMRVICWFVFINGLANWICVILYDPSYPKSKDNPHLDVNHRPDDPPDQFRPLIQEATNSNQNGNGNCIYDMTSKEALPWEFCDRCKRHVPPRAHHCKYCRTCILKRDHHCFMVGNCIGFKNQRYFVVLAFYAMVVGIIGGYFTYKYLKEVYWPTATGWTDLVPPIAVWRWIFGATKGHICLMVVHVYLEFLFGFMGWVYFTSQFAMTAGGKTLYENAKKIPIKSTNTVQRNLRSVFGDFWLLNFMFPMTLVFRQRDDGIHWEGIKYDHTAGEKWKDDGVIM